MKLSLSRILKAVGLTRIASASSATWWGGIAESYTGAWQRNAGIDTNDSLLRNSAVYACVTGIATDIAKLRVKLTRIEDGVWVEVVSGSPWLPVLQRPNHFQNRIKFIEQWILSKLLAGNSYILKKRDARGIVNAMYVLDPRRVQALVAEDGGVYYQLNQDFLSDLPEQITVPASEIIHDMMPSLWHPLLGVSPLTAGALSGTLGRKIQNASNQFFTNRSMPGGILTAPGTIHEETAVRLKRDFEENFSGEKVGRLAVLGDGLKFEPMAMTAEQSQLAEQLKLTIDDIARAFHYPAFKLGAPLPPYASNVEALIVTYYTDCLQILIESLELCLDEGLALSKNFGTELDLDNLWRMDTASLYKSNMDAVNGGWMKPNEARFKANFPPVEGGDTPYLQQQNYSLAALAKRDARDDPFGKSTDRSPSDPAQPGTLSADEQVRLFTADLRKELIPA